MAFMKSTRAVVKQGVWNNRFMAGVVRATNYIPNLDDPERLIADCASALHDGANLVIFPEGSRTPGGEQGKYQRGFAYIALQAGAPILTVTIEVAPPTLRKGEPWYAIPERRPHWIIRVRERVDTPRIYGTEPSISNARRLTMDIKSMMDGNLRK